MKKNPVKFTDILNTPRSQSCPTIYSNICTFW